MANKIPEHDDPMALKGMMFPAEDEAPMRDMACCFIEEFLRMGHTTEAVEKLFCDPFYAGPHAAYKTLGAEAIQQLISEYGAIWGRNRSQGS